MSNYCVIFDLVYFFYRLPQIYEEYRHSIQNADAKKDLKWWSNNHGVGMAMNWPQFEVSGFFYFLWIFCSINALKNMFSILILFLTAFDLTFFYGSDFQTDMSKTTILNRC